MLLDLIDLSKVRRTIIYGFFLALVFILQDLIVFHVPLLGVRPMLIPAAVTAIGLFEGGVWGGALGLAAGYFADRDCANYVVLYTVLLPTVGFFAGVLGKYMLHKGFVSFLVLTLLTLAVITFCQMFRFLFLTGEDARQFLALYLDGPRSWPVLRTGLIQVGWSLIWSVPLYFPCKFISARPLGR